MVPEDREASIPASVDAELAQLCRREEQVALLAVVEIGNDVQSLHRGTPFQAKIRSRGTAHATSGVPLKRDALKPRAAGAVLAAEVYPSERYRGEKVRKYNRINRAAKSTFNAFRPKFFPAGLSSETFRCPTLPPRRRRLPPTSSTPSAPSRWTRSRKRTRAIPACRWAWRRSPRCSGGATFATTRRTR